jgi:hypothetical protein
MNDATKCRAINPSKIVFLYRLQRSEIREKDMMADTSSLL